MRQEIFRFLIVLKSYQMLNNNKRSSTSIKLSDSRRRSFLQQLIYEGNLIKSTRNDNTNEQFRVEKNKSFL